jgi:hypothetical protein
VTSYGYDPDNRRVYQNTAAGEFVYFYGIDGTRWGTYQLTVSNTVSGWYLASASLSAVGTNVYFMGGLVIRNGAAVNMDQRGSIGKYLPYGEERPGATANDTDKFATYFRDASTGLDYAMNRYYSVPKAGS